MIWLEFMIIYGILLEVSLFYARYMRHIQSHDEIHATLAMMIFMSTFICDIYYSIVFKDDKREAEHYIINVVISIIVNIFVLMQIVFGTYIRHQMRSFKRSSSKDYYWCRFFHKWLGYFTYLLTKGKLLNIS